MEIQAHTRKLAFNEEIDLLLDDMQRSFDAGNINHHVDYFQQRLDALAAKYQDDESLGKIRYKLYEAQAYIHYFMHDKVKATDFIDEAVRIRGSDYQEAASLRSVIAQDGSQQPAPPPQSQYTAPLAPQTAPSYPQPAAPAYQHRHPPAPKQPITGWLAFFTFGIIIGVLYNFYLFFSGWGSLSQITPDVSAAYPNLRTLIIFEQLMPLLFALVGITLLVLVFRRNRLVRPIGIAFLASVLLWFLIDLAIANQMFANNADALKSINSISGTEGRSIVASLIWMGYLIFSKDVKKVFVQ